MALVALSPAHGQGKPMNDAALSDTWGQALLDLTNTSQGGYDFSRLTLNADISLSMTLTGLKLGTHADGKSDIDISTMSFGRSDLGDSARTVSITNPYLEWVYSGDTGTASRQVIGMRLGFGGIAGDVGLAMNTVSGTLTMNTPSGAATSNASQSTALTSCAGACTIALNAVGGVTAGDATTGASRDFFLSILKSAVAYPTTSAALGAPALSQAGFWLNWTDRLNALNTTGTVPPNVPKIGP
ncbi:MAG: hypothetical protein ABJD97_04775 [Betaproteobacteria bacterium]